MRLFIVLQDVHTVILATAPWVHVYLALSTSCYVQMPSSHTYQANIKIPWTHCQPPGVFSCEAVAQVR